MSEKVLIIQTFLEVVNQTSKILQCKEIHQTKLKQFGTYYRTYPEHQCLKKCVLQYIYPMAMLKIGHLYIFGIKYHSFSVLLFFWQNRNLIMLDIEDSHLK